MMSLLIDLMSFRARFMSASMPVLKPWISAWPRGHEVLRMVCSQIHGQGPTKQSAALLFR
jgi:hypothetical protein